MTPNQLPVSPIEKALSKLRSAQICHPKAVQHLIEEAIEALAQQAQEPVAMVCDLFPSTRTKLYELGFAPDAPLYTTPQPQPAPQVPAPVDERTEFEASMREKHGWEDRDFKSDSSGYFDGHTATARLAWQDRAALSKPAPQAGEVTREQMVAAVRPLCNTDAVAEKLVDVSMDEYRAILALRPTETLTGCNCRLDGETQVEWCELHLAHKEAIHEWAERAKEAEKQLALSPKAVPMTLPQVEGDVLPPVGSKVLIHLASSDSWAEHEVVGYYVWEAINELAKPRHHRVFVRVRDSDGILNARHLCDVRGITAKAEGGV